MKLLVVILLNVVVDILNGTLNRSNALIARNWQRIKMLEEHFGLEIEELVAELVEEMVRVMAQEIEILQTNRKREANRL